MTASNRTIADELRRRISTGALAPGDALPSVRAICRRWKVAPGTASRALQRLVAEGLVRAVPRSGHRVAGVPENGPELTQKRIVAGGIHMADRHGLERLSIRALAEELNTRPMSLYRHVESKEQLIWLMVDSALGELPLQEPSKRGWRAGLELAARQEWQIMRRHPWLSRALHVSRPGTQPTALAFADRVMASLSTTRLKA